MRSIQTPHAPTPAGHYAQAWVHQGTVYVAGILPLDPAHPDLPPGSVEAQAEQVLRNVESVLVAAGSGLDLTLLLTVYVSDLQHWGIVDAVFARILGDHRPARVVVPVGELRKGFALQVQTVAATRASAAEAS